MMRASVVVCLALGALAAWWLATRCGCRHVDERGVSWLSWSYDESRRLRGYCWACGRFTKGWGLVRRL